MTIKSDIWIKEQCEKNGMVIPFFNESIKTFADGTKIPSYGITSYGYDIRLGRNFSIFKNGQTNEHWMSSKGIIDVPQYEEKTIDLLNYDSQAHVAVEGLDWLVMPPHSFVLAHSEEYLNIPKSVSVVCMNKSTWARMGVMLNVTPAEPGWEGYLTLEISNTTNLPVKIWTGVGVVQLQFFEGDKECSVSYSDRNGKYNNQPKLPISARN